MRKDNLSDDPEDSVHPPEERASAGARSTRVSVAVKVGLATTQVIVGGHAIAVLARHRVLERHRVLDLMTHIDPWRSPTPMAVDGRRGASSVK